MWRPGFMWCWSFLRKMQFRIKRTHCELIDNLEGIHEKDLSFETLADIVYIAGYVIRHDLLTEDTSDYCEKYGSFLKEINRGGLRIPGDSACSWTMYCYVVFHEVNQTTCRKSIAEIFFSISEKYYLGLSIKNSYFLANIFFNNLVHHQTLRSSKEAKQKVIKLSSY